MLVIIGQLAQIKELAILTWIKSLLHEVRYFNSLGILVLPPQNLIMVIIKVALDVSQTIVYIQVSPWYSVTHHNSLYQSVKRSVEYIKDIQPVSPSPGYLPFASADIPLPEFHS